MTAHAPMAPWWEGHTEERPATPNMDGISQERIDDAVRALAELVVSTLRSPNPNRFAEAERLCYIGQQLIRTQASTLDALAKVEEPHPPRGEHRPAVMPRFVGMNGNYGNVVYGGAYGAYALVGGMGQTGGVPRIEDQGMYPETRREALIADPARQVERERAAAEIAAYEGTELAALLALPEPRPLLIVTRIATLSASIETRNHAHAQRPAPIDATFIDPLSTAVPVVPPDFPWGPPAREDGRDGDRAPGVRANGYGGEGACHLAQTGDEGALLRQAMGG